MNAYSNHYQNNQILTASSEQILIMLYDGAIRFVKGARLAIEEGRMADKARFISKAVAIITEFSNTLDHEIGGELAQDLSRLYDFMVRELAVVNAQSNAGRLDAVEKILLELREGFVEAAEINRKGVQSQLNQQTEVSEKRVAVSF